MPFLRAAGKVIFHAHVPKCGGIAIAGYLKARFGPIDLFERPCMARPEAGGERFRHDNPLRMSDIVPRAAAVFHREHGAEAIGRIARRDRIDVRRGGDDSRQTAPRDAPAPLGPAFPAASGRDRRRKTHPPARLIRRVGRRPG